MNIVNVGYKSTNYYVLADAKPRLLIDAGWPGTLPAFQRQCEKMGIHLSDLKHILVTHYHPDHAGLAQELKRLGSTLIVVDLQLAYITDLRHQVKPQDHYVEIDPDDNLIISLDQSRSFLKTIAIGGEIVATPGHSDDSVTLVLDQGAAFTGDLTAPLMADEIAAASWDKLRALGVKMVYPGHGPAAKLPPAMDSP
jgi:glyoxylase-like metal-dependent hydrolase (beta-lactamase superfamily II)